MACVSVAAGRKFVMMSLLARSLVPGHEAGLVTKNAVLVLSE